MPAPRPCRNCMREFVQHPQSRYTTCPHCRTPAALAAFGYGWEDIKVQTGLSEAAARDIVFDRANVSSVSAIRRHMAPDMSTEET